MARRGACAGGSCWGLVSRSLQRGRFHTAVPFLKRKTGADHQWLERHLKDPFVKAAKQQNYRCRSAFKLLEIDDKLHPTVPTGFVLGIDLQRISPLDGAVFLSEADVTDPGTLRTIHSLLPAKKVDVILSDMAPNATGIKELDHQKLINLCLGLLNLSQSVLKPKGTLLCKFWDGQESRLLQGRLKEQFQDVRTIKPQASRKDSAESYYLARQYKGK